MGDRLAKIDMAENWEAVPLWGKLQGPHLAKCGRGPRPTSMPSFILIRPTVWPQYTNVTDRQADRQTDRQADRTGERSDGIGRTVLQTVTQ